MDPVVAIMEAELALVRHYDKHRWDYLYRAWQRLLRCADAGVFCSSESGATLDRVRDGWIATIEWYLC
jgi:hypothetical protein